MNLRRDIALSAAALVLPTGAMVGVALALLNGEFWRDGQPRGLLADQGVKVTGPIQPSTTKA